jgi:hypothetical protein
MTMDAPSQLMPLALLIISDQLVTFVLRKPSPGVQAFTRISWLPFHLPVLVRVGLALACSDSAFEYRGGKCGDWSL